MHRIAMGTIAITMTAMPMASAGGCSDCSCGIVELEGVVNGVESGGEGGDGCSDGNGIEEFEGVVEVVASSGDGGDDGGGGDGVGLDEDKRLAIATMITMIATITVARAHTSS